MRRSYGGRIHNIRALLVKMGVSRRLRVWLAVQCRRVEAYPGSQATQQHCDQFGARRETENGGKEEACPEERDPGRDHEESFLI